ncbi:MAG: hypothetical protein H0U10_11915 [Chloroflexia bacterium]|nr:hypothetical protein [Chloroflexia bacterium]
MTLRGVRVTPESLDRDFLWVSLGRYQAAVREPDANREIRQAILRVAPLLRTAEDPNKSEVGIPLESIGPEGRDHLHGVFSALKRVLAES